MSSEKRATAIRVANLSKRYEIYARPEDRLKQAVLTAFQRYTGLEERRYFREFWALHDVSFEVGRGETVGIVGKNGAGKSTLLHLIVGTHAPTTGSIEINGRVTALLELGSGFNPQFTGRENVYLNAAILGLSKDEVDRRFDEIAAFAEIGDFIEEPVSTYSSGMYLRLAFAVQVCLDPDILVVDEALAVGDAYFVHRCFHRIRAMKEQGKTILFVSHDTGSVVNICDRAIWIKDGRVALDGDPAYVTAAYRADLFRLSMTAPDPVPAAVPPALASAPASTAPALRGPEHRVPNADRRLGARGCHITGLALYDPESLAPIAEARAGGRILARVSWRNESIPPGSPLVVGYMICTPKGEELGGANSRMEGVEIAAPAPGANATLRLELTLPGLHAGHYALTVAIASATAAGELRVEDRIENALVFTVLNDREVFGWIRLPSTFVLEHEEATP